MTTKKTTPVERIAAGRVAEIIEPHWPGMFRYAVQLVEMNLDEDDGKKFVVEMLQFGQRLSESAERTENEQHDV